MKKILVILGPTATGKTDLAIGLAKKFNGELVACDSRQVYMGLDIGTGKLPRVKGKGSASNAAGARVKKASGYCEMDGVRVWMYDVVELPEQYTVADYVEGANRIIEEIFTREKLPVVVGGSGLYLKALLEGLDSLSVPFNSSLRKELEGLEVFQLQEKLHLLSPARLERMNNSDRNNPRRLVRAIELGFRVKGPRQTRLAQGSRVTQKKREEFDVLKIGLTAPREVLYQKINERVLEWFDEGIVEEVRNLIRKGISFKRIKELGLEYRTIAEFLEENSRDTPLLVKVTQDKIRQYAKRQITWFKKERGINWFDVTKKGWMANIEKLIQNWYNST